jgi:acyl-coenzyme A synthetase/AMP-(fatty) acid ligase/thioesterase domain-containing protein/acyl carrier protein
MPAWLENDQRPLDWNGPVDRPFARFPDEALGRPVIERLASVAREHRDRIAITGAGTALTYGELWDGLTGLAEKLAAETEPGDLIGILLPASPTFPVALLACLAAGRPFVALDTHYPREWLDHVLKDAQPKRLITDDTELTGAASEGWQPAMLDVDEPACVLFTSGSTGRPKGIVNSQRNLLQRVAQSINAAHVDADDRFLTLASPCTIVGVRDVLTALLAGASIRLLDPQQVGGREILEVIRTEGITILFAFPALLRSVLAASSERAPAALRLVRVGGDTTLWSDIDLLREWLAPDAAIQSIYAATEAPMLQWFVDDACRGDDARVPIGYTLTGNPLAIVDERSHATPRGEVGELIVASHYVALGQRVDGRWVQSLESYCAHRCRVFRTGDLVRQRPDGLLERVGRKDRQIKIRGARVDLDGVEAALRRHPEVRDVAAFARTDPVDGAATLVAYVSARDGCSAELTDDLRELMRTMPSPMRPAHFHRVHEIPRLPSSKLDVRGLQALDDATLQRERARAAAEACLAPVAGDCIEQTVARVWTEVLRVPVRSPDDDFFDAGGDSLKAITFTLELERALQTELSFTLLNETPEFGQLCEALKRRGAATRYVPLVPLKAGMDLPPVFFIHGIGGNVIEMLPTARRMTYAGPIIGIRARGLGRGEAPHASIDAMATDYLQEITRHQPHGPYHLCGYSFGGLVAFEIARRLSESGKDVGLVGLFDTTMGPLKWPLRSVLAIISRRILRFATSLRSAPIRTWPNAPTRVLHVAASALIASARYEPGFYRGHLTLFSPAARDPALPSLEALWRKHARTISIIETAGDHTTMLSASHADATAASLTRCLQLRSSQQRRYPSPSNRSIARFA